MEYQTLFIEYSGKKVTIWLNRPDIRNAFNEIMISELIMAFREAQSREETRVIFLRGKGKAFCAGADLNWMRDVANYNYEQNLKESLQLSECFNTIYNCTVPTIAVVHGAAIGGANGLLSACDIAVCTDDTVFSLSEVKIGIVPACISPFVIKRVGEYGSKELMLTGRRINGKEAEWFRLVNKSMPASDLEAYLDNLTEMLMSSGPKAVGHCKVLIDQVSNKISLQEALTYTAGMIAEIRSSDEGQEGMAAFLEKRKPNWIKE
ncbi:MAG TPA: enoyl-CoA hydratase-related protein [Lentimicrobium sp.]|nr:enoyl-CoA hydratase-related protein [Lentimicrobium sp.]